MGVEKIKPNFIHNDSVLLFPLRETHVGFSPSKPPQELLVIHETCFLSTVPYITLKHIMSIVQRHAFFQLTITVELGFYDNLIFETNKFKYLN